MKTTGKLSRIQDLLSKTCFLEVPFMFLCSSIFFTCFLLKKAANSQKNKKTAASSSCFEIAGIIWDAPGHVPGSLRFGVSTYRCSDRCPTNVAQIPEKNRFQFILLILLRLLGMKQWMDCTFH